MNELSIGRIVHYVADDGKHKAAIVTAVWGSNCCNLQVFTDGNNEQGNYIVNELSRRNGVPNLV